MADRIAYKQQQAEKSFVERFALARANKERILKKYSTIHYNERSTYRGNKDKLKVGLN